MLTKFELYRAVKALERNKPEYWLKSRVEVEDREIMTELQSLLIELARMDRLSLEALSEYLKKPSGRFALLEEIERE